MDFESASLISAIVIFGIGILFSMAFTRTKNIAYLHLSSILYILTFIIEIVVVKQSSLIFAMALVVITRSVNYANYYQKEAKKQIN